MEWRGKCKENALWEGERAWRMMVLFKMSRADARKKPRDIWGEKKERRIEMTELKTAGQTSLLQRARTLILCFVPFLFLQNNVSFYSLLHKHSVICPFIFLLPLHFFMLLSQNLYHFERKENWAMYRILPAKTRSSWKCEIFRVLFWTFLKSLILETYFDLLISIP